MFAYNFQIFFPFHSSRFFQPARLVNSQKKFTDACIFQTARLLGTLEYAMCTYVEDACTLYKHYIHTDRQLQVKMRITNSFCNRMYLYNYVFTNIK